MNRQVFKIISLIIITSTLMVAILGSNIMTDSGHIMVMFGCSGAVSNGGCAVLGLMQHLGLHAQAFQDITNFVVGSIFVCLVLLFTAVLCSVLSSSNGSLLHRFYIRRSYDFIISYLIRITRWLVLHEKRDPYLSFAMNM